MGLFGIYTQTHIFTHTYFKNYNQHYSNYSTKHSLSFSWNFWVGFCEIVSICSCITFSLHSNYVSCIIDVCLIIVECVPVGFDWVSPMMQFKFCTSHVHAYFMHTYPFIPIYGCDFVSLSLSLSHRLRTAPKATPSQNHLQGFGSSSSDPIPPHHVWFRDEKARKDFLENFQKRGVHSKCHVVLSNFSDTPLPTVIRTWGWESLCERLLRCSIVFIQEFYSNIHHIDTSIPWFATTFWGRCIVVTLDFISEVPHVPQLALPNFPNYDHL